MALALHCKYPKPPRTVEYKGVVYPSINAFFKYTRTLGCKAKFGSIRYAIDTGRNLDDVIAGKTFEKKVSGFSIEWKGVKYPSIRSLYRALKKYRKVKISAESFGACLRIHGIEYAVDHLLHPKLTNCAISKKLGGSDNLVLIRLKNGWSRKRAITEPCRKKGKKHGN